MLTKEEIIKLSKLHALKPWQEEKRYMLAMILSLLYEEPTVFRGGTYLWLFHGLRRFSEELDFTFSGQIYKDFSSKISENLKLSGIKNEIKILGNNNKTFTVRFLCNGPLNTGIIDRVPVYVEINKEEVIMEKPLLIKFDFPEYNLPVRLLYGMNLTEVASEKIRGIYTRKKSRDIYDLYYLITKKNVDFNIDMVNAKLQYYNVKYDLIAFKSKLEAQAPVFAKQLKDLVMDDLPDINDIITKILLWANINA